MVSCPESEKWFVARVRAGQDLKIRDKLVQLGYRHYIPSKTVLRVRSHRRLKVESPVVPNLVFLKVSKPTALSLANGFGLPLSYIVDRKTRTLLVVPEKQMDDFIRVTEFDPDSLCPPDAEFTVGGRVRVIAGELEGVEGEIIALPTLTYLLIGISSLLRAKVRIPRSYVEPI